MTDYYRLLQITDVLLIITGNILCKIIKTKFICIRKMQILNTIFRRKTNAYSEVIFIPVTILYVLSLTDITHYAYNEAKSQALRHNRVLLSMFIRSNLKMTKWLAIHSIFTFKLELYFCAQNDFNGCSVNIQYRTL